MTIKEAADAIRRLSEETEAATVGDKPDYPTMAECRKAIYTDRARVPDLYGDVEQLAWRDVAGLWPELDTPVSWQYPRTVRMETFHDFRRSLLIPSAYAREGEE